jgi:hypothetical protein
LVTALLQAARDVIDTAQASSLQHEPAPALVVQLRAAIAAATASGAAQGPARVGLVQPAVCPGKAAAAVLAAARAAGGGAAGASAGSRHAQLRLPGLRQPGWQRRAGSGRGGGQQEVQRLPRVILRRGMLPR